MNPFLRKLNSTIYHIRRNQWRFNLRKYFVDLNSMYVFSGDKWEGIQHTLYASAPLVMIMPVFSLIKSFLYSLEEHEQVSKAFLIQIMMLFFLIVLLYPKYGVVGAVIAVVIGYFSGMMVIVMAAKGSAHINAFKHIFLGFF